MSHNSGEKADLGINQCHFKRDQFSLAQNGARKREKQGE
jgi:hypothetical protein